MTATFDPTPLCDLTGRVAYFPVRHHSPTAARLVRAAIDKLTPDAVLIEGPADFNPQMSELLLPHRPPVAIYSYARTATPQGDPGPRSGAYYPFCEHSPEWQAARYGHARGAVVRFIDLPWADSITAPVAEPANRYADAHLRRSKYTTAICRQLGVDTFDDAWDVLFEQDSHLSLEGYLFRCHAMCGHMRLLDGGAPPGDDAREAYMAARIREAVAEFPGKVLVVTGGYHSLGLFDIANGKAPTAASDPGPPPLNVVERGIALTPYSFERLDNLAGYNAGMPNPGFYHHLWQAREAGNAGDVHAPLLRRVAESLRAKKQHLSAADLIAAETTARALAAVRGHPHVWRTDLVDGLIAAVIKDDQLPGTVHPVLEAVREVLRGGQRGVLAEGTSLPPLVHDVRAELDRLGLTPAGSTREMEFDLETPTGRECSKVLHRVRLLDLGGFTLTASAVETPGAVKAVESWSIGWTPDFDAHLIEASRYGPALADAAAAKLTEGAARIHRDAAAAARLLVDAALAGLDALTTDLLAAVRRLIATDADFFAVAGAVGKLLFLYRYDAVLGTAGRPDLGDVLRDAFARGLWLFEGLGRVAGRDKDLISALSNLVGAFEKCEHDLGLDRSELYAALRRAAADRGQVPVARGAALGGLWALGDADGDFVTARLGDFADPDNLGDFLTGLFALAREQVQRQKGLLLGIHDALTGFGSDDFLAALPALRLAFTYFTPREKNQLAAVLRGAVGLANEPELAALAVGVADAAAAFAFEEKLFATLAKYGVRGGSL